jgi:hypothetical protein
MGPNPGNSQIRPLTETLIFRTNRSSQKNILVPTERRYDWHMIRPKKFPNRTIFGRVRLKELSKRFFWDILYINNDFLVFTQGTKKILFFNRGIQGGEQIFFCFNIVLYLRKIAWQSCSIFEENSSARLFYI